MNKGERVQAGEIKAALIAYLRFERQMIAVTEYKYALGVADVWAVNDEGESIEVEVKISMADLRSEVRHKAGKWQEMLDGGKGDRIGAQRFFFCVPREIETKAMAWLTGQDRRIGLMIYHRRWRGYWKNIMSMAGNAITVRRQATWIHQEPESPERLHNLTRRLSAEVAAQHYARYYLRRDWYGGGVVKATREASHV